MEPKPDRSLHPAALNPDVFDDLTGLVQALVSYDHEFAPDVQSVDHGHKLEIPADEGGAAAVTVYGYTGIGNFEYGEYVEDQLGVETNGAAVKAEVVLQASYGNTELVAQVFLLSDFRAVAKLDFRAASIKDLQTPDSANSYFFLEQFGLGSRWYRFEHEGFDVARLHGGASEPFSRRSTLDLDETMADGVAAGLETFLDKRGSQG